MASIGSGIRVIVFDDHEKLAINLRSVSYESILFFSHLPTCSSFIEQNIKDHRVTIVVTTKLEERVLQTFEFLDSVECVLIFSQTQRDLHSFPSKVIGIYSTFDGLFRALVETLDVVELQLDANTLLFHRKANGRDNTDFYFYDLWKNYNHHALTKKKTLIDHARVLFQSEESARAAIQDFQMFYKSQNVLHWLDKLNHPFPYHLLVSNALRTHDQQILSLVRFFIWDLLKEMHPLPMSSASHQVFFGTKLPIEIVDRLEQQTSDDVIAFQCFLPTTKSRNQALHAATRSTRRRRLANVLFKIDLNDALCAHLTDIILVEMATPFRVKCVTRNTGFGGVQQLVTVVTLAALARKKRDELYGHFIQKQKRAGRSIDDFLYQSIPLMRIENGQNRRSSDRTNVSNMAIPMYMVAVAKPSQDPLTVGKDEVEGDELMLKGNWAQAADAFERIKDPNVRVLNKHGNLLRDRLQDNEGALELHKKALEKATDRGRAETYIYLGLCNYELAQYAEALDCYNKALEWFEDLHHRDAEMIAKCYVGIGNIHWARREFDQAFEYAERALILRENEVSPRDDFDIAACLANLGNILHDQGDSVQAVIYTKRAVDLLSKCGPNDRRMAAALNNLAAMHQSRGEFDKAREAYNRALQALPSDANVYRQSILNNLERLNEAERHQSATAK